MPSAITVSRRGVTYPAMVAAGISAAASLSRTSPTRSSMARRCIRAGISSERSSSSSSPISGARQPGFAARFGQGPDPADIGGALGDADHAARVEQVEQVARLEGLVVGRERQGRLVAGTEQRGAFGLGVGEMPEQLFRVGALEVEGRELALGTQEDIAIAHPGAVVVERVDALDTLDIHGQALKPVGQLGRDRVALDAADLLEIGELADLHAVEPDLPAEAPGAQGRAFPIVLDKGDVVARRVDADRLEAVEIERLAVGRSRLQDYLELLIVLEPVRVLA